VRSSARGKWRFAVAVAALCSVAALGGPGVAAAQAAGSSAKVTTCAVLSKGSTGPAVRAIQQAIGKRVTGKFGAGTIEKVKAWQRAHELPATGRIDAGTWAHLPPSGQAACGDRVLGSGVALSCALLSSGSSGLAVTILQQMVGTAVNGRYGGPTVDAVEMVQAAADLKVTGTTNQATWRALTLFGTPECSTATSVLPPSESDAKAQARIRKLAAARLAELDKRAGTSTNPVALQAMAFAKSQIGQPYVWGGTGPKGYDCSGLQMTSYRHAGLTIPRTAAEQYAGAGRRIPLNEAKQGDLLFYASDVSQPSTVYHVAMYVGDGDLLDAPQTGEKVKITPIWSTDLLPVVVRPVAELALPAKVGDSGWTVSQLQLDLNRHGAGLAVDGGFGPETEAAVKSWQQAHKLSVSGIVGVTTWLSLK